MKIFFLALFIVAALAAAPATACLSDSDCYMGQVCIDEGYGGTCMYPPARCGDGNIDDGEYCDDGDSFNGPCPATCSYSCTTNVCVDTDPPTIDIILPTGEVLDTSVNFVVSTNEFGECRWSTTNQGYAEMPSTQTMTGTEVYSTGVYSTTFTGLTRGSTYTYYASCRDLAGNAMTTARGTTFNIFLDTVAPGATVTQPRPNRELVMGTTETELVVETNEASTCRWSTSNQAYDSMTGTFSTSGTSHSTTITGLENGLSYTRYVRCRDTEGNTMTTSATSTFSVSNVYTVDVVITSPTDGREFPQGTTSVPLTVSTDVPATCTWSEGSRLISSMTPFTTTGGRSHSTTITNLRNGELYVIYVKCQEGSDFTKTTFTVKLNRPCCGGFGNPACDFGSVCRIVEGSSCSSGSECVNNQDASCGGRKDDAIHIPYNRGTLDPGSPHRFVCADICMDNLRNIDGSCVYDGTCRGDGEAGGGAFGEVCCGDSSLDPFIGGVTEELPYGDEQFRPQDPTCSWNEEPTAETYQCQGGAGLTKYYTREACALNTDGKATNLQGRLRTRITNLTPGAEPVPQIEITTLTQYPVYSGEYAWCYESPILQPTTTAELQCPAEYTEESRTPTTRTISCDQSYYGDGLGTYSYETEVVTCSRVVPAASAPEAQPYTAYGCRDSYCLCSGDGVYATCRSGYTEGTRTTVDMTVNCHIMGGYSLPSTWNPSDVVCNPNPTPPPCGNGVCAFDETPASCPADCTQTTYAYIASCNEPMGREWTGDRGRCLPQCGHPITWAEAEEDLRLPVLDETKEYLGAGRIQELPQNYCCQVGEYFEVGTGCVNTEKCSTQVACPQAPAFQALASKPRANWNSTDYATVAAYFANTNCINRITGTTQTTWGACGPLNKFGVPDYFDRTNVTGDPTNVRVY